jgi:DNA-binding response OmpR family regulator
VAVSEHEPEVAEMIRRCLDRARLPARITTDPARSLADLRGGRAAVYVLDLTMPGLDLRMVRRAVTPCQAPVVFLAGQRTVRPRGLGSGPAQRRWLTRPFSPRVLTEIVTGLVVPPPRAPAHVLPAAISVGDRQVQLTPGESALLTALAGARGRPLSREQLLVAIGSRRPKVPGSRVVDVHVTQLRAKLGHDSIRTIQGIGYAAGDLGRVGHDREG